MQVDGGTAGACFYVLPRPAWACTSAASLYAMLTADRAPCHSLSPSILTVPVKSVEKYPCSH